MICVSSLPDGEGAEEDAAPPRTTGATDREAHLVVGPGDRVDDRDDDREQGQRDHDQQEGQVPEARSRPSAGTLIAM